MEYKLGYISFWIFSGDYYFLVIRRKNREYTENEGKTIHGSRHQIL